jgi:hypothetical protein
MGDTSTDIYRKPLISQVTRLRVGEQKGKFLSDHVPFSEVFISSLIAFQAEERGKPFLTPSLTVCPLLPSQLSR